MSSEFDAFMKELVAEARLGRPMALAEFGAFGAFHRLALEVFQLRKERGLTQRQVGAMAGIQQRQRRRPSRASLVWRRSRLEAPAGVRATTGPAAPPWGWSAGWWSTTLAPWRS